MTHDGGYAPTAGGHREVPPGERLSTLLSRLDAVTRHGDGWQARCPAHEDRNPSLSVRTQDNRILVKCFAGCSADSIMRAAGLSMHDLFTDTLAPHTARHVVATYDYTDAGGAVLFQVVRYEPKDFRQRRPDEHGGWSWNLKGVTSVPFRLPLVLAAAARGGQVFITEGEKDVLTLERHGLTATCNAGGAGKWRPDFASALRGAHVVILPDNDAPGYAHGQAVAATLRHLAASVKVLDLAGLPAKGDVSDWFNAGHTGEELLALAQAAPEWEATATPAASRYPLTDLGNAERLIAAHGHELRYHVNAESWLRWTGTLWRADDTGEVHRLARAVVRSIGKEADGLPAGEERESLYKHMLKSESAPRLAAGVDLARYQPGVPVTAGQLDGDTWALNLLTGTLDLHTGQMRSHAPGDLLTKLAPVTYDPAATCPRWERFLREIFPQEEELVGFVQRLAGYLLTGDTREQAAFFLVGKGANGKSVLLESLRALLGDYARDTSFATFLERRDTATNDLASLHGARLATASEGEGGQTFNEALLKRVTGGDQITCRYLYREYFTYTPAFKVLFATNEVPRFSSQGYAMRRRVHILPFSQTFYGPADGREPVRDDRLRDTLRGELPGILAWAVRGCLDWQQKGLRPPRLVQEETAALFASFDPLADFLDDACTLHPSARVEVGALWKAYLDWCEENERQPAFRQTQGFSRNLTQRDGIDSGKGTGGVRVFKGIGLKA